MNLPRPRRLSYLLAVVGVLLAAFGHRRLALLAVVAAVLASACGAGCEPKPCDVPTTQAELCMCGAHQCTACFCDSVECNAGVNHVGRVVLVDCVSGEQQAECGARP